jgi:hypothetical protein
MFRMDLFQTLQQVMLYRDMDDNVRETSYEHDNFLLLSA